MNARADKFGESLAEKTEVLFDESKLGDCISKGDKVAIKTHMGTGRNVRFVRSLYIRSIVEKVRQHGGDPFVCDTTTLSSGPWYSRNTALDYLKIAVLNGYTSETVGCPIIIGDGWLGDDDVTVEIDGISLKKTFIAKAFAMADAMIVVSHAKAEYVGFGGALKNVGVGCLSKRGKYLLHGIDPNVIKVRKSRCLGINCKYARVCEEGCPEEAIKISSTIELDKTKCFPCYNCFFLCNYVVGQKVFYLTGPPAETINIRIADGALALTKVLNRKKIGCINYLIEITPECDCMEWSDMPFVPDIGILASRDMVAIDAASIDLINKAPGMPGSLAEEKNAMVPGVDKFRAIVGQDPYSSVDAAEKLGLGTKKYELIEVPPRVVPATPDQDYLRRAYRVRHPFAEFKPINPSDFYKDTGQ